MRTLQTTLALCAALALPLGTATAADEDHVKYRQAVMKSIGGHMGAMAQIVKQRVPHQDHLSTHARSMLATFGVVEDAFSMRTEGGETRAKPEIWQDFDGFKEKIHDARNATQELVSAIESGGDVGAAMKQLGDTCGGCHKEYREKKE